MGEFGDQDPLVAAIDLLREPVHASAASRDRVMAAIRALPGAAPRSLAIVRASRVPGVRRLRWSSTLGALVTAAGFSGLLVLGALQRPMVLTGSSSTAGATTGTVFSTLRDTLRLVHFALVAPGAVRVALVGDFNDWDATAARMMRDPSGDIWRVALPLAPGDHTYAFVVNDTGWVGDPLAAAAPPHELAPPRSIVHVGQR